MNHQAGVSVLTLARLAISIPPRYDSYLRIFLAGWLNQVRTLFCQSLWKWGFRIIPLRLGAMAAYQFFPGHKTRGNEQTVAPTDR